MHNHKIEIANEQIKSVTNLSIVGNIALSAVKVTVGLSAGSMALVADGIHSISDLITDAAVLLGLYFGSKGPDEKHPYGKHYVRHEEAAAEIEPPVFHF